MSISAFVLLYCLCAVELRPADSAPAGPERAVSSEPAILARSTGTSSVYSRTTAADATDSAGRDGSATDGEVNISLQQTLDALLDLVADTSGSVFHQHSAELKRRMDDLSAEMHRGTRLAANASTAILRLLRHSQTQLQTGLTQLRMEHTRIIEVLELLLPCPTGWIRSARSCFIITESTVIGFDADSSCKAMHPRATLASIHADTKEQVNQLLHTSSVNYFWIGLRRGNDDGPWFWTDGTAVDYTNWRDGEPNNAGGSEDCVQHCHFGNSDDGWNDISCEHPMLAICQLLVRDIIRSTAD